jgi:hypothetical protein
MLNHPKLANVPILVLLNKRYRYCLFIHCDVAILCAYENYEMDSCACACNNSDTDTALSLSELQSLIRLDDAQQSATAASRHMQIYATSAFPSRESGLIPTLDALLAVLGMHY